MKTKYGDIPSSAFEEYQASLINRIWILLPLREENCPTLKNNIERINRELHGMIAIGADYNKYIITVMNLLENAISEQDFEAYRSDILRCCELTKRFNSGGDHDV